MDKNHLGQIVSGAEDHFDENINISDVIEVIATDPEYAANMNSATSRVHRVRPTVIISEQPATKALRFRYECEGRSAGSIPGASSTNDHKTYPTIRIHGTKRNATIFVSCVTKDAPHRAHPHNLVGREGCVNGICQVTLPGSDRMEYSFSHLGIQCVKKRDIESALTVREEMKVDPFSAGFSHKSQPTSIDLNVVRLCFQVFLESEKRPGTYSVPLDPVISEPIFDKKAMSDLVIIKLSHCTLPADGGNTDVILLCEKVTKEDIEVIFSEQNPKTGAIVWSEKATFQPSQVHKQTGIWFRAPAYRDRNIDEPVNISIYLHRPTDGLTSESVPFQYVPIPAAPRSAKRKKLDSYDTFKQQYHTNIVKMEPTDHFDQHQYRFPEASPVYYPDTSHSPIFYNQTPVNNFNLPSASGLPAEPLLSTPGMNFTTIVNPPVMNSFNLPSVSALQPINTPLVPMDFNNELLNLDAQPQPQQATDLPVVNIVSGDFSGFDQNTLSETFRENVSLTEMTPNENYSIDQITNHVQF